MDAFFQPSYGYDLELDSDDDAIRIDHDADSSDEEDEFEGDVKIRQFLREYEQRNASDCISRDEGTRDEVCRINDSSGDEDDLEKELNAELETTVAELERRRFQNEKVESGLSMSSLTNSSPSPNKNAPSASNDVTSSENDVTMDESPPEGATGTSKVTFQDGGTKPEAHFYDKDYFDSDDDEEGGNEDNKEGSANCSTKKGKSGEHPILSNDDLFYDPDEDDDNQQWMDQQRDKRRVKVDSKSKAKQKAAPKSDAILDCPSCLTTVCIDCQRHEIYQDQFRAMFVQNCDVDDTQKIKAPMQDRRKRKHGGKSAASPSQQADGENEFPAVKCSECRTVVGAMDSEEIYYFFNVVPCHT